MARKYGSCSVWEECCNLQERRSGQEAVLAASGRAAGCCSGQGAGVAASRSECCRSVASGQEAAVAASASGRVAEAKEQQQVQQQWQEQLRKPERYRCQALILPLPLRLRLPLPLPLPQMQARAEQTPTSSGDLLKWRRPRTRLWVRNLIWEVCRSVAWPWK